MRNWKPRALKTMQAMYALEAAELDMRCQAGAHQEPGFWTEHPEVEGVQRYHCKNCRTVLAHGGFVDGTFTRWNPDQTSLPTDLQESHS